MVTLSHGWGVCELTITALEFYKATVATGAGIATNDNTD